MTKFSAEIIIIMLTGLLFSSCSKHIAKQNKLSNIIILVPCTRTIYLIIPANVPSAE